MVLTRNLSSCTGLRWVTDYSLSCAVWCQTSAVIVALFSLSLPDHFVTICDLLTTAATSWHTFAPNSSSMQSCVSVLLLELLSEELCTAGDTSIFKCELFFRTFSLYAVVTLQRFLDSVARTTYIDAVCCYRPSIVVCRYVTLVSPAKTAEPIEVPFGLRTQIGSENHVLDKGPVRAPGP